MYEEGRNGKKYILCKSEWQERWKEKEVDIHWLTFNRTLLRNSDNEKN